MKKTRATAEDIMACMGGAENLVSATHCMTRLRITVRSEAPVQEKRLRALRGVLSVVHDREDRYEIVLGPGICADYADRLHALGVGTEDGEAPAGEAPGKERRRLRDVAKVLGDIFAPLIPGIITAGLCAGFASLLAQLKPDYADVPFLSALYSLLTLVSTSFMTYITAWAGYRAAERFGGTPILGGMLGMMTSLDGINQISRILGLYNEDAPLASVLSSGKGGILSVVFGVFLLCAIEKRLRKRIPASLSIILTPLLSVLLCAIPYIAVVMPACGYVSGWISTLLGDVCRSESAVVRAVAGYVASACFLPLVATGMHHGLISLYTIQLQELGYVTLYPALTMAGAGQVGAGLAVRRLAGKTGRNTLRQTASGAIPAGILGVGEPLIYSVTLPLGKPFVTACLGAGFGGAIVMVMQVASTTWGPSGIPGVFVMTAGPHGAVTNAIVYLGSLLVSCAAGFLLTFLTLKEKDLPPADAAQAANAAQAADGPEAAAATDGTEATASPAPAPAPGETVRHGDPIPADLSPLPQLAAPADGRLIPMADLPDPVFSSGKMGVCVGIDPESGSIYAPCDGTVVVLADTKHAVALQLKDGKGLLLHLGIDTVNLAGKGFTPHVAVGDAVTRGQLIMEMDIAAVRAAGLNPVVILCLLDQG